MNRRERRATKARDPRGTVELTPKGFEVVVRYEREGLSALSEEEQRTLPVMRALVEMGREHMASCPGCVECITLPLTPKGRELLARLREAGDGAVPEELHRNLAILRASEEHERNVLPRHMRVCPGCEDCESARRGLS